MPEKILEQLRAIASNPRAQLDKYLADGKKVVGIMPYFCPEELVDASGMIPFGVWGADMQAVEAKRYFPAFICSILQTTLELGMTGKLNGLSAIMIPFSCDSLKTMGANWQCAVPDIPLIDVAFAQNRKLEAGTEFTSSQFGKIRDRLSAISGRRISDESIAASVRTYNENRAAMRRFVALASVHPDVISPADRCAVIKAGYFMARREHTELISQLNDILASAPEKKWPGKRIVTTGIIADAPELLKIFADNGFSIAADQVAYESVSFLEDTPVTEDPICGIAKRLGSIEGCSVLYDPKKYRAQMLIDTALDAKADGIVFIQTKFCDPEEFDWVPVKRLASKAGIPLLQIEIDRQMDNFEQIRSAVEAFAEIIG